MAEWWAGFTGPLQAFYMIGLVAAALLALQLLLLAFGFGGDFELGDDAGLSGAVSFRGLTAFFFVFGWVGVLMEETSAPLPASVAVAGVAGALAMAGAVIMWRKFASLEADGSLDYATAVGTVGRVYVTVSDERARPGKIMVVVQGRLREVAAFAEPGSGAVAPGARVEVVDTIDPSTVLVRPLSG